MSVKDELHALIDQLDEAAAHDALALLQDLRSPGSRRQTVTRTVDDLELAELPGQRLLQVQEPED